MMPPPRAAAYPVLCHTLGVLGRESRPVGDVQRGSPGLGRHRAGHGGAGPAREGTGIAPGTDGGILITADCAPLVAGADK